MSILHSFRIIYHRGLGRLVAAQRSEDARQSPPDGRNHHDGYNLLSGKGSAVGATCSNKSSDVAAVFDTIRPNKLDFRSLGLRWGFGDSAPKPRRPLI